MKYRIKNKKLREAAIREPTEGWNAYPEIKPKLLNGNRTYEIFHNGKAIGFATAFEVYEILRNQLTEDDLRKLPMSEQEAVEYHFASGRDEYTYDDEDGNYVFAPVSL